MVATPPSRPSPAPFIVTAELPADIFSWANSLRTQHFPPERNWLKAHVTLFHAFAPSLREELRGVLARLASEWAPPLARIEGLMDLGRGTALAIRSPAMLALRQWGQKYGSEQVVEDPVLVDERDRLPIGPVSILAHDGRILGPQDLWLTRPANLGHRADGTIATPGTMLGKGDVVDLAAAKAAAAG